MASAAGRGPAGGLNKVSRHPGSSVCVSIFALLSAGSAIRRDVPARSAGFQTCCIADFQVGRVLENARPAGLETRDTADLEVCATVAVPDALRCDGANFFLVMFAATDGVSARKWFCCEQKCAS